VQSLPLVTEEARELGPISYSKRFT